MPLGIIIEILSLILALCGILLQTRRDPSAAPSWRNLSNGGRLILFLIVIAASIKIIKSKIDSTAQHNANAELLKTNQHLIKVMSVSSGYNALLTGIVIFEGLPAQNQVEKTLSNLFLKYAEVQITATNSFGTYEGRVDYGAHPEVRRFLNIQHIQEDSILLRLRSLVSESQKLNAYFFEIRCANLKILSKDKIQYAHFDSKDQIHGAAKVFEWWHDFRSLYGVRSLYIDKLTIEELGEIQIGRQF
jgi:hypothetical protein